MPGPGFPHVCVPSRASCTRKRWKRLPMVPCRFDAILSWYFDSTEPSRDPDVVAPLVRRGQARAAG